MRVKNLLGLIIGAGAVCAAIIISGSFMPILVALKSILPILFIFFGVLIAGPGVRGIAQVSAASRGELTEKGMKSALETLGTASKALAIGSLLCFLSSFVLMAVALEDAKAVWINLAWAMAPAFFALLIHAFVILPMRNDIMTATPGTKEGETSTWNGRRFFLGSIITLIAAVLPVVFFVWYVLFEFAAVALAIFVPIALIVAGSRSGSIKNALRALKDRNASQDELEAAIVSLGFAGTGIRYGGLIGAATGFLFMVKDWTDRMRTGPTLALALLSAFYACLLYLIFALPLLGEAKRRLALVSALDT